MFSSERDQSYEALPQIDGLKTPPMYTEYPLASEEAEAASSDGLLSTVTKASKDYTPYKLELHRTGLYPEFLYHFKKSFSSESATNEDYCTRELGASSSHSEEKGDQVYSVEEIDTDFDAKFRQCLHPDFLTEYSSWKFTRECVETTLKDKVAEPVDLVSFPIRLEELTKCTRKYKTEPLVDFLLAYDHLEPSVWNHVIDILLTGVSEEKQEKYKAVAQKWQDENGPLAQRVQSFADEIKPKGLCPCCVVFLLIFVAWFVFYSGVFK